MACKRATLADVRRVAAAYGAEVLLSDGGGGSLVHDALECIAPTGRVWAGSGTHAIVAPYGGRSQPRPSACADLVERMGYGLEPCPDAAQGCCDTCNDL